MHYLYYVIIDEAKNSQEAREYVRQELENQNFASDSNRFFGSSKADWFVIGGRWSGNLQKTMLLAGKLQGKDFFKEIERRNLFEKSEKEKNWTTSADVEKYKDKLQALWEEIGGVDVNPYNRDNYNHTGYDDDAMKITPELLAELKKEKEVEVYLADAPDETLANELDKEVLGKWIVVVDYHN